MRTLKYCLGISLLLIIYLMIQQDDNKIWVFILSGQSNMVGSGLSNKLSEADLNQPSQLQYYRNGSKIDFKTQDKFGPEVSLAKVLTKAFPNQEMLFIKYAVGGASLYAWEADWTRERAEITENAGMGHLYKKLLDQSQEILEGKDYEIKAFLWMQGERDAKFPKAAELYKENLTSLVARLRQDFKAEQAFFVFGMVNPPISSHTGADLVQKLQREASESILRAALVSSEGLSKLEDNLHYDEAGLIELGNRFGEKLLELLKYP